MRLSRYRWLGNATRVGAQEVASGVANWSGNRGLEPTVPSHPRVGMWFRICGATAL